MDHHGSAEAKRPIHTQMGTLREIGRLLSICMGQSQNMLARLSEYLGVESHSGLSSDD